MEYSNENNYKISQVNGIIDIVAPHSTRVIIKNSERALTYFDTTCLPGILESSDIKIKGNLYYMIYGTSHDEKFELILNMYNETLEVRNSELYLGDVSCIDITKDCYMNVIIKTHHPVYQFTKNKAIILMVLFIISCYTENKKIAYNNVIYRKLSNIFLNNAKKIYKNINPDKNYYLDEMTILILSVYSQGCWIPLNNILNIVDVKIQEARDTIAQLKMENLSIPYYNKNAITECIGFINKYKKRLFAYNNLSEIINGFESTDELLELNCGVKSYFLIRRDGEIMTFVCDNKSNIKYNIIDKHIISAYLSIIHKSKDIIISYNEWCYEVSG
jgi:hypothetical protein